MSERRLPPVAEVAIVTLALIVIGGVYLAAHLPHDVPLAPAVALLGAAGALLAANVVLLARIPVFAWDRFRLVAGWSFVAYLVIAGMLEYVFVLDHTGGARLVVLTLMLAVFALDIPVLFGFSVARYQQVEPPR